MTFISTWITIQKGCLSVNSPCHGLCSRQVSYTRGWQDDLIAPPIDRDTQSVLRQQQLSTVRICRADESSSETRKSIKKACRGETIFGSQGHVVDFLVIKVYSYCFMVCAFQAHSTCWYLRCRADRIITGAFTAFGSKWYFLEVANDTRGLIRIG